MIEGIGIDIIEIERIQGVLERKGRPFLERLFTMRELERIKDATPAYAAIHIAGRFAAKEAVVKALGTGFRSVGWKEIEILNDASGKPFVVLHETLAARFDAPQLLLSISHSKEHASAFCLWQK